MKVLQINTTLNTGSTGRIAESIGVRILKDGGESVIAYGRNPMPSVSEVYKIGSRLSIMSHVVETRIFDNHSLSSRSSTKDLVEFINKSKPDIIHLHNIHGYYLNYRILFKYLLLLDIPIVWTLHDCWTFTGHCTHFEYANCDKWMSHCYDCPEKKIYPASYGLDASKRNHKLKKKLFSNVSNLTLVTVSNWLKAKVEKSFFKDSDCAIEVIHNGIDLNVFKPNKQTTIKSQHSIAGKRIILGVCNGWSERKGYSDFIKLASLLDNNIVIVMIGVNKKEIAKLPENILGIELTQSVEELVEWYSVADVLFNPTYEDSYPSINLESIACGTPVVSYSTGGSVESVGDGVGFVIPKGRYKEVLELMHDELNEDRMVFHTACRSYALENFDKDQAFSKYINLYKELLQ